jgi:hypothetical protein
MAPVPTLILRGVHANPTEVKCSYKTCKDHNDALQQLLSTKELEAFGTW